MKLNLDLYNGLRAIGCSFAFLSLALVSTNQWYKNSVADKVVARIAIKNDKFCVLEVSDFNGTIRSLNPAVVKEISVSYFDQSQTRVVFKNGEYMAYRANFAMVNALINSCNEKTTRVVSN